MGKGAFGRVMKASRKDNGQLVAIKVLDKAQIQKLDKMKYVKVLHEFGHRVPTIGFVAVWMRRWSGTYS